MDFLERFPGGGSNRRPVEWIFEAEELSRQGKTELAERRFVQAIERCRKSDREDLALALGRFGAFLLGLNRRAESRRILAEAIDIGTDLPAVWSDYLRVLTDDRDLGAFLEVSRRLWSGQVYPTGDVPEFLLSYARQASREGGTAFAEALIRSIANRTRETGDVEGYWAAIGDLGEILERAGRVDEAVDVWSSAWREGSRDSTTANRLSLTLERRGEYQRAAEIVYEALERKLPASTEETLRKRLIRCEQKISGSSGKKKDVQAFSVRSGGLFRLAYQVRTAPPTRSAQLMGKTMRCFGSRKGEGVVTDIDVNTGHQAGRSEGLPDFSEVQWNTSGEGIGTIRTSPVGKGPTELFFLQETAVVNHTSVPDATSNIAWYRNSWLVGCRDGYLYCFDPKGDIKWRWETPASRGYEGDAYLRPCPYRVVVGDDVCLAASMGNLYGIDAKGGTRWTLTLPQERQWKQTVSVPMNATDERGDLTLSMVVTGSGPIVSDAIFQNGLFVVCSSRGFVYKVESATGRHLKGLEVGTGHVWLGASDEVRKPAWCNGRLVLLDGDGFSTIAHAERMPQGILWFRSRLFIWDRAALQVLNPSGNVMWEAEFSKWITSVIPMQDGFVCTAGVVTRFVE